MLGAPGAGKGTQAARLAEQLGMPHVASGDLFRDHIKRGTDLGKKVKKFMDAGALVPDDVTIAMISDRLSQPDANDGVILDGFPRTRAQAEALDKMLGKEGGSVAAALYIDVDRDVLIKRLSGRWVCSQSSDHVYHETAKPPKKPGVCDIDGAPLIQRDDDKPETIRARMEKQLPPMFEVVDHYADRGVLNTVEGDKPMEAVTIALLHCVTAGGARQAQPAATSNGRTPAPRGADIFASSVEPKARRGARKAKPAA
jgi:adenylate kinase